MAHNLKKPPNTDNMKTTDEKIRALRKYLVEVITEIERVINELDREVKKDGD